MDWQTLEDMVIVVIGAIGMTGTVALVFWLLGG
jgi:hypothetical protein